MKHSKIFWPAGLLGLAFLGRLAAAGPASDAPAGRVYHSWRDMGSARKLEATNGVLHIFVRGKDTEPWDSAQENITSGYIKTADEWLRARAAESTPPADPVFVHRSLVLPDDPFWRKMAVPDYRSSYDYQEAWLAMVLARFRAESFSELFKRAFKGVPVANRCVVFHTARSGRSFAFPEFRRESAGALERAFVCQDRSMMIHAYEGVAYAHELLHLYGADDLYNKVPEPGILANELMNHSSMFLEGCVLCPLTRYAIGWLKAPPPLVNLKLQEINMTRRPKKGQRL